MYRRLIQLLDRPFVRNVATLITGTALAQAIGMAFSPVLARQYGPVAYGIQGVFGTLSGIAATVAALTYPVAMILPSRDEDAIGLGWISLIAGFLTSVLTALAVVAFGAGLFALLNAGEIAELGYLLPISMFTSVLASVLSQWLVRKRAFRLTAVVGIWQAIIIGTSKAGVGLVLPSAASLIWINTVGGVLGALVMLASARGTVSSDERRSPQQGIASMLWRLARRYRDFPLLRAPQVLLNACSHALPVALLAVCFGPREVGYFGMATAVLALPASVIGAAVSQVFYPRVNDAINRGEDARSLIVKATAGLAISGAIPLIAIEMAGPWIFATVFGSPWAVAGTYARWLALWLFFQYINKPAVAAIAPLGLQGGLLVYELFSTGSKILALYAGYFVFRSDVASIALFSMVGVVAYAWLIAWVIRHSGSTATIRSALNR